MFAELLARISAALESAAIPYMVIGGQAVLVHGEPRLTRDIDITLGVSVDGVGQVVSAVAAVPLTPLVDPESFVRETYVLPCQDPQSGLRVDLVFSDSAYEQQAIARSRSVKLAGQDVRFATAEDLIIHKLIAGRPRDIEDVRGIIGRNARLDATLIRRVLGEFEQTLERSLVTTFDELLRDR
jgi:hypothetical protein